MKTMDLMTFHFCAELAATAFALGLALVCRWAGSALRREPDAASAPSRTGRP